MKHKIIILLAFISVGIASDNFYYQDGKKVSLKPLKTKTRTANNKIDLYSTPRGQEVGVSNTLIVQLKNVDNLENYLVEFSLEKVEKLYKNMYLLKVHDKSLTIKTANALYKKPDVEFAHQNFLKRRIKR